MFEGIHKDWIFLFILGVIVIVQFFLVELGGVAVKCSPLSIEKHLICVILGAGSILISLLSKANITTILKKLKFKSV